MIRVSEKIGRTLTLVQKQNFSNMLFNSSANPIKERVMSTPTWPVPYYQRMVKAYPVREKKSVNLSLMDFDADDTNWYAAKEILNETLKGRQIVEYTEKNIKTNTYLIRKNDCETMVRSYVDDCGQFLDIANRENVRILAGKTLI
jgi:hypothetical protein